MQVRIFLFVLLAFVVLACSDRSRSGYRVAEAREQASANQPNGQVIARRVWSGREVDVEGSVSPDGHHVSFVDWSTGDLALHDLATGQNRRLTKASGRLLDFALSSSIAPDGRHVAYTWLEGPVVTLRIVDVDGSQVRTLYQNKETVYVQPATWSPDGKQIVVVLNKADRTNQIGLVSTADGSTHVLKTLDWRYPGKMAFSPDGRYIAYDFPPQETSPNRDVFVLAADGSQEVALVKHQADDRLLGWAPEGRTVLFASDRSGSTGAWAVDVVNGRARGGPRLVKADLWRLSASLGVTRTGVLYYGVQPTSSDVYTATLDSDTGRILSPAPVSARVAGQQRSADWSPDGRYLAYLSQSAPVGPTFRVMIRSLETGEVRELSPNMNRIQHIRWFPDGQSLLALGYDEKARGGFYRIDVQTGAVTPIHRLDPAQSAFGPTLSPDGTTVYYRTFTGEKSEISLLMALDVKSGVDRELYRFVGYSLGPASSSLDGQQVAFAATDKSRRTTISVIPSGGGEPREVYRVPDGRFIIASSGLVAWTRDKHLLFVTNDSTDPAKTEMWRVGFDGGQAQKLDIAMPAIVDLRLHPDGQRLAFTAGEHSLEVWALENVLPSEKTAGRGR